MQSNIGLLDRYVRLVSGLMIFGAGTGMRRVSPFTKGALMAFGAMKVAEGVTGWCPLMHACGLNAQEDKPQTQPQANNMQQALKDGSQPATQSGRAAREIHKDGEHRQNQPSKQIADGIYQNPENQPEGIAALQ